MVIRQAAIAAGCSSSTLLAEHGYGFAEQPAQLLDGARLDLLLGEILLDELGKARSTGWPALRTTGALERARQRRPRIRLRGEATALNALGLAAAAAVAKRPQRPPVRAGALELGRPVRPAP